MKMHLEVLYRGDRLIDYLRRKGNEKFVQIEKGDRDS